MKKIPAVVVCGLAAMLLTVVLYFVILNNVILETIHFIALLAILLAECVTTGYAWAANGSPRKVASAVVSGMMIPYAVVLSVVYIVNFPSGYATYIGWYCAGMVAINLLAFIFTRFDANKSEENDRFQAAKNNMLGLRKIVKCIMADEAAKPYEQQLRALEEKLHFSNDNVIAAEDEDIRQLLQQLQGNVADPEFDSEQMIKKIEKAIDVRNIMTSRNA